MPSSEYIGEHTYFSGETGIEASRDKIMAKRCVRYNYLQKMRNSASAGGALQMHFDGRQMNK